MRHAVVLCDLDGVVLDYPTAEAQAFAGTAMRLGLHDVRATRRTYAEINAGLWQEFEQGAITPERLRVERWRRLLEQHGLDHDPAEVSVTYLELLARAPAVLPGAVAALRRLAAVVPVVAVTNGFSAVQHGRVAASGIGGLFTGLVVSDDVAAPKPDPAMFEAALALAGGPAAGDAVMVGDNHDADVVGASALGMDTVWIAPDDAPASPVATWRARSLRVAATILLDG
jgi:2-haloacid dehalogenase